MILGVLLAAAAPAFQESCGACHGDVGHSEAGAAHAEAGITCVSCHGGTPGVFTLPEAHVSLSGPRGPRAEVELCGGCHADNERMRGFGLHTDPLDLFWTSAHGRRLAEADDAEVATCTSCHGVHGVLSVTDPRSPAHPFRQVETCGRCHADEALMARHSLAADQPELFRVSVHGRVLMDEGLLSAPACTGCHGSHGATPPRVEVLGRVCGRCHAAEQARFEESPHINAVREGEIEACVSCHGSHGVARPSREMLIGEGPGHCAACHAGDADALALGTALHAELTDFDARLAATEERLAGASERGIFVEPESDMLAEARALRERAGPLVHALSPQALSDVLEPGAGMLAETGEGIDHRERALRDRKVFVLVFLAVDLLLVAMLLVHAREVAGRATGTASGSGGRDA